MGTLGQSTLCQVVKQLIDPRAAGGVRGAPRDERDLMIAAMHHHVLLFDNLSFLPDWLSDALSRLATGGGFATRQLYEDAEEQIFDAVRPIIVSGIPELASRTDLVSRAVFITLPTIDETNRKPEAEFWAHFDSERPAILGQLLDCVSMALRHERTVRLATLPRMADFARWVYAAEPVCPWESGRFFGSTLRTEMRP
jgi:putative DNA primase/helicase